MGTYKNKNQTQNGKIGEKVAAKRKRYRPGLTEKRMNDKRFRRTEDAILRVFFEEDNYVSLEVIARKAGVARSTIYNHHRTTREIVPDYERYLMRRYRRRMRKLLRQKGVRIRTLYFNLLVFIIGHKGEFEILMRNGDRRLMNMMVRELTPKTTRLVGAGAGKVLKIYTGEVVEVIWIWGEDGFGEDEASVALGEIMYLTETMKVRLGPLMKI